VHSVNPKFTFKNYINNDGRYNKRTDPDIRISKGRESTLVMETVSIREMPAVLPKFV